MLIRRSPDLRWSQVTPRSVYMSRRRLLTGAGALAFARRALAGTKLGPLAKSPFSTDETQSSYKTATTYNNFYEFGTRKEDPAGMAHTLRTRPWTIKIDGAVGKPRTFDIDSVMKLAPLEERIYRLRCVEGWSIVVPWIGFPLNALIKQVEPTGNAKYVAFESLYDPRQMPAGEYAGIPFPYKEGLRIDEAMHPLTLLCVGMYGETLPNQNGAPVRLVIPWKYGFKSIKSVVHIKFVEKEPSTTWRSSNSREYGFYSNVNPQVDHPRWSQANERRLGEIFRRPTLMFNGYGEHVASMYSGMDLRKYY
jgi:methionine sulfoxide reductase catalytic subunit